MILENKVKENRAKFISSVKWIEDQLSIPSDWLMAVMYFESGLNPRAQNPYSSAVGLLQWISSTAASLGTSRAQLLQMSNVEQLNFVYKYLRPFKGRINSVEQLYLAVASPAYLESSNDTILPFSASTVAANKAWNINKDEKITVGEIRQFFRAYYNRISSGVPFAASGGLLLVAAALVYLTVNN